MVFGVVLVWFCYGFGGFGSGFGMSLVGFGMLLVWFWYGFGVQKRGGGKRDPSGDFSNKKKLSNLIGLEPKHEPAKKNPHESPIDSYQKKTKKPPQ